MYREVTELQLLKKKLKKVTTTEVAEHQKCYFASQSYRLTITSSQVPQQVKSSSKLLTPKIGMIQVFWTIWTGRSYLSSKPVRLV